MTDIKFDAMMRAKEALFTGEWGHDLWILLEAFKELEITFHAWGKTHSDAYSHDEPIILAGFLALITEALRKYQARELEEIKRNTE